MLHKTERTPICNHVIVPLAEEIAELPREQWNEVARAEYYPTARNLISKHLTDNQQARALNDLCFDLIRGGMDPMLLGLRIIGVNLKGDTGNALMTAVEHTATTITTAIRAQDLADAAIVSMSVDLAVEASETLQDDYP